MLDVRLITVLPQPNAISQPSSAPNVTTQGATVQPQLQTGSILSGFIINRDTSGNPILRTSSGDVVFASQLFLKIGSEVTIRIQNNNGVQSARILSVNGQAPEISSAQYSHGQDSNVQIRGSASSNAPAVTSNQPAIPQPAIGSNLNAVVVIPALPIRTPQTPVNNTPASLSPGTNLLLSVLGINTPAPAPNPSSPLAQLTSNTPPTSQVLDALLPDNIITQRVLASPVPITAASSNANTQTSAATPQQPASTTPTSIPNTSQNFSPNTSPPLNASNQQAARSELPPLLAQNVIATVASVSKDGSVTLNSSLGYLRIPGAVGLNVGDQVSVRVTSISNANGYSVSLANNTEAPPPASLLSLAKSWPSLQQIVQIVTEGGDISLFKNLPQLSLSPAAGSVSARIASPILFFISALSNGDFRGWVGHENVKKLEDKGYGTLLRKAEGEFISMVRQFLEPPPGQWQSLFFPVAVATELTQVRAFIKRDKKKDAQNQPTGEEDTRFIVEMELSQLGSLQMDGLVQRKPEEELRFDLIIRSHEPLPAVMQRDIEAIYYDTGALTQYRGRITFQSVLHFPIQPLDEVFAPSFGGMLA